MGDHCTLQWFLANCVADSYTFLSWRNWLMYRHVLSRPIPEWKSLVFLTTWVDICTIQPHKHEIIFMGVFCIPTVYRKTPSCHIAVNWVFFFLIFRKIKAAEEWNWKVMITLNYKMFCIKPLCCLEMRLACLFFFFCADHQCDILVLLNIALKVYLSWGKSCVLAFMVSWMCWLPACVWCQDLTNLGYESNK